MTVQAHEVRPIFTPKPVPKAEIDRVYEKQLAHRWRMAQTTASERIARLKRLKKLLWERRPQLHEALYNDFRKHPGEADLTEVLPCIAEINHTISHLAKWMKPKRVKTPTLLLGTRSEVRYEPKGLVLILSPWNYPVNLLVNPLVATIAAGNCAIIKPSSKVPHTAHFLNQLFADTFPEEEVALFEGSSALAEVLLEKKFDHIVFTGSPRIGKSVMAAAAKHLTPVTLELGGKSPVIVDETADIQKTAERAMWGKFLNAGQTCVAPDYMMIHESRVDAFIAASRKVLEKRFGQDSAARKASPSFCRLVSKGAHSWLTTVLAKSVEAGATIEFGGDSDPEERYLEPTLLSGVTNESPIMQDEIFGPILPILTYRNLDEAIAIIHSKEKPLALYIFSENQRNIDYLMANTTAGGTCINTMILHLANPDLPFGGVGHSGMGNYHGFFGFRGLSHERAVLRQGKVEMLRFFYPPYSKAVNKLIEVSAKYLS